MIGGYRIYFMSLEQFWGYQAFYEDFLVQFALIYTAGFCFFHRYSEFLVSVLYPHVVWDACLFLFGVNWEGWMTCIAHL